MTHPDKTTEAPEMPSPKEQKCERCGELRIAERYEVTGLEPGEPFTIHPKTVGRWVRVRFIELVKGDIFRLKEPDGRPDVVREDGTHDVCVALTSARPFTNEDGVQTSMVESAPVNHLALPLGKSEVIEATSTGAKVTEGEIPKTSAAEGDLVVRVVPVGRGGTIVATPPKGAKSGMVVFEATDNRWSLSFAKSVGAALVKAAESQPGKDLDPSEVIKVATKDLKVPLGVMTVDEKRQRGLLLGLQIFSDFGSWGVQAQHDVIYAGGGGKVELSLDLAMELRELGWHEKEEFECWAFFT